MSDIYLSLTETPSVVTLSQPVVSGVLSSNVTVTNVVSVNVVTMPAITVQAAAPAVTTVAGTVAVSNFPAVTTVAGTVALDSASLIALENVTVTVGAAVTVAGFSTSSLPPSTVTVANTVTINGTVTANDSGALTIVNSSTVTKADVKFTAIAGAYNATDVAQGYTLSPINVDIKGISYVDGQYVNYRNTCVAELVGQGGPAWKAQLIASSVTVSNSVTIGSVPNGSLTTRFGTPTTANTAFATSAVTNASRKYLLIQNVTTGSNVITVGIGFTPTTTQGIQLTAGAGITFESSYIPTGAVYVLSSVTASNFTILEA